MITKDSEGGDVMPYASLKDLPNSVIDNLPKHAQEIYLEAYNSAWEQYERPEERKGDDSREQVAHKVAWSAVKQGYEKRNDRWIKRKE
jgi:cation transport regulator